MYVALALGPCQFEPSEPRPRAQGPGRAQQLHDRKYAAPPAAGFESTSAVVQLRDRVLRGKGNVIGLINFEIARR